MNKTILFYLDLVLIPTLSTDFKNGLRNAIYIVFSLITMPQFLGKSKLKNVALFMRFPMQMLNTDFKKNCPNIFVHF